MVKIMRKPGWDLNPSDKVVNSISGAIVNIIRSVPFVILMVLLITQLLFNVYLDLNMKKQ